MLLLILWMLMARVGRGLAIINCLVDGILLPGCWGGGKV